jgi:hypothetical protein
MPLQDGRVCLSGFTDSFLFLAHHDPPFVLVPDKDQPTQIHHVANQVVDGSKHFDGRPRELLQPKVMQNAFESHHESFYGRLLVECLVEARQLVSRSGTRPKSIVTGTDAADVKKDWEIYTSTRMLARLNPDEIDHGSIILGLSPALNANGPGRSTFKSWKDRIRLLTVNADGKHKLFGFGELS